MLKNLRIIKFLSAAGKLTLMVAIVNLAGASDLTTITGYDSRLADLPASCEEVSLVHRNDDRGSFWGSQTEQNYHVHSGSKISPEEQISICLSCHDGVMASKTNLFVHAAPGNGEMGILPGASIGHPVGMDYGRALEEWPQDYKIPASNSGIWLEDNKVTCLSCHRRSIPGYQRRPAGYQTALCLTCHIK